ncbi:acetylxylan esterase [Microbacterium sp. QXD-8]|uniref:Acetylxylan esterase n=1 Tax=Microbacterium psychrotolerans TaxID=3068321 RepID=A0ABU0YW22_9MICO|nr:acetylxylan esterase [Microbacterium sp. QXD-8]MDQ7876533.1 acetylxylan esterase [Microbacterium sp. QXD-8]
MIVDLIGDDLLDYRSPQVDPPGFDEFWRSTIDAAREFDTDLVLVRADSPVTSVDIFDLSFHGFGGERISGWLRAPRNAHGPLPVIVEFIGYGGGRGLAEDALFWASCGYLHVTMDTRGQGAVWARGVTADRSVNGPTVPGLMTAGVQDPHEYYYRRLITDAVRAVDAAVTLPQADRSRVIALGMSQGGGVALATAALSPHVTALVSFQPFLCDFPRAIMITGAGPYGEIDRYLRTWRGQDDAVLETLRYFDGVNFARRATVPAWFTTSLMDDVCPPSTVVAAFNAYAGATKDLRVERHRRHEHGTDDNVIVAEALANLP